VCKVSVFNTNNYLLLNKDAGIGDNLLEPFNQLYIKGKHNNKVEKYKAIHIAKIIN
jgi:hypothetical protein